MIVDELRCPIVLAPLGGGPSTPELAVAVSDAGGLGFLAAAYLKAADVESRLLAARRLTSRPLGVNVFAPGAGPSDAAGYAAYVERLRGWAQHVGAPVGEPRWDDDDWDAKIELLSRAPVEVVSFTFGCPSSELIARLRAGGFEVWITVTEPEEARHATQAGADVLVVQGAEAGGHRASFIDRPDLAAYGLLPLLDLVRTATTLPLVASGGIATGRALAGVLAAGAVAAQIGTAFMLAPEAGTGAAHRRALRSAGETVLTRAFTGRLARGIRNEFIDAHDASAPIAYPEIHYLTASLRKQAREAGDPRWINLWAGEGHELARERPASEIVREPTADARAALEAAHRMPWMAERSPGPPPA